MKLSKKDFLFHLLNSLFLIVFSLLAFEGCVRYLVYGKGIYLKYIDRPRFFRLSEVDPAYKFPKEFYRLDRRYGWNHTPDNAGVFRGWRYPQAEFRNEVHINSSGFRDTEPYSYAENKLRIAVLGDSFIQALQVHQHETIPEVIEAGFSRQGLNPIVYNFGVSSIGTIHQYKIFQEEVVPLKPDIVILSFFPNDLVDNSPHYKHERPQLTPQYLFAENGEIQIKAFDLESQDGQLIMYETPLNPTNELKRASKIIDVVKALSIKFKFLKSLEFFKLRLIDHFGLRTDYDYPFDVYRKEYPPALEESMRVTCYLMEQLHQYCQRNGIRFMVVLLPAREQVLPQYWKEHILQRRYILSLDQFDLQKPTRLVENFLREKGIPCLNALPAFEKSKYKKKYYYSFDHHFTAAGQKAVADMILEFLPGIALSPQ